MNSKLTVTFDGGTSLSKILYKVVRDGKIYASKYLVMHPEVMELVEPIQSDNLEMGQIQQRSWIQLPPKKAKHFYAVGKLAKTRLATASIRKLKHDLLIPKILAAIGAIATIEKLQPKFELDLLVLLPLGEYDSKDVLETALKRMLKYYWYRGNPIKVALNNYRCYPEGLGIALEINRQIGIKAWKSKVIGILVFGYRNISWLLFSGGNLIRAKSKTTDYGFYHLLDCVVQKLSGITREELQDAIVTKIERYRDVEKGENRSRVVTNIEIEKILKEVTPAGRKKEVKKIKNALDIGILENWKLIEEFLYEVNSFAADEIYYCGGTGVFLKNKLSEYYLEKNVSVYSADWCNSPQRKTLIETLGLSGIELDRFIAQNLETRFSDCWHLLDNLSTPQPHQTPSG